MWHALPTVTTYPVGHSSLLIIKQGTLQRTLTIEQKCSSKMDGPWVWVIYVEVVRERYYKKLLKRGLDAFQELHYVCCHIISVKSIWKLLNVSSRVRTVIFGVLWDRTPTGMPDCDTNAWPLNVIRFSGCCSDRTGTGELALDGQISLLDPLC